MARGKTFQVRLSDEEHALAEAGARDGGYESLSSYIRACIRRGAVPLGLTISNGVSSSPSVSVVFDAATCPNARMHRKGALCKSCQTIAAKDGE